MNQELKLFKYLNVDGATASLRDGTHLFTSPVYFNDPFDISIQTLFAYDAFDMEALLDEVVNFAISGKPLPASNGADYSEKFAQIHAAFLNASEEDKRLLRSQLSTAGLYDMDALRVSYEDSLYKIKTAFEVSGIFCASKRFDNYLMWAHYSQHHQGAVLEFVPNLSKDSILRLAEEVTYSEERPHLYRLHRDYLEKAMLKQTEEVLKAFTKEITTTKSLEWAYEEELRVYKPLCVDIFNGKRASIQYFHDDELRGVYLGCKMEKATRMNIMDLAERRNPKVKVFEMVPDPYHYKLEAKQIR